MMQENREKFEKSDGEEDTAETAAALAPPQVWHQNDWSQKSTLNLITLGQTQNQKRPTRSDDF